MKITRYLRQYFRPAATSVEMLDASYERAGQQLRARVYRPARLTGRAPAWIVLHGLTYHGLDHPGLQRFASALAASGHVVFIPEIREWTQLLVSPALTTPTIRAAAHALNQRSDVEPDRIGVFGFSFGATQGLVAATDPEIAKHVRALVAWGGYCELPRLVHFGLTGEHELDGVREHIDPDPYGRWMFGGNYLTRIPGYENMQPVAAALLDLAREAGRSGVYAGDPVHKPLIRSMAQHLTVEQRKVYELFAPIGEYDLERARVLAGSLAETIARVDPLMDAMPYFGRVRVPVLLAHGRDDRLVPYTETLRVRRRLPPEISKRCTITSLFAHSGGTEPDLGPLGLTREAGRFIRVLHQILTTL